MNNKEFVAELSKRTGQSIRETNSIMEDFTSYVTEQLADENQLSIQGFGTFDVKKKLERVVVNPATKLKMLIPPKIAVSFKASNILKDKVNQ